ncbi:MAG TPA: radical SAM protein [Candidatus Sulfotelmatobacter sp.]|nr:radical SAM protein [Candidatus Sulfotelmatobacter sp.]
MGYKCQVHKLEYNVAHHCNLKCDHCDHLSPFFGPKDDAFNTSISLEAFDQQLAVLSRHVHSEEFLILGGEPLLHKNCLGFFKSVKASGITDKAVLVTNGFLLDKQGDELFEVLDKITISFYPSLPLKQEAIDKARQRCQEHSVELEIHDQPKFSMSIIGIKNEDDRLVDGIFNTCTVAWTQRCYALHDGYVYRCSRAPFIAYKLLKQGLVASDFSKEDGLKLEDTDDFGKKAEEYFNRTTPLKSCSYCLGSVGKRVQHRQLSKTEIKDEVWARHSISDSIDRVKAFRRIAMWRWLKLR